MRTVFRKLVKLGLRGAWRPIKWILDFPLPGDDALASLQEAWGLPDNEE